MDCQKVTIDLERNFIENLKNKCPKFSIMFLMKLSKASEGKVEDILL